MSSLATATRSLLEDARAAAHDAASQAASQLGSPEADLTLVFATAPYDQEALISTIGEHLNPESIIGCSGEGTISGSTSSERDHALSILAVRSESLRFERFLVDGYGDDPQAAGTELGRQIEEAIVATPDEKVVGLWLFPDGLRGNCTDMLDALRERLPLQPITIGGTAADAMAFERTYQYYAGRVVSGSVVAVLIRGRGQMEVAVSHGCTPIGLPRTVTHASGSWVHEIDHQPAWEVFRDYLDGDPQDLNGEGIVHLCIGQPLKGAAAEEYAPYVIRTPLQLDKPSGALLFPGGGLDTGETICMTRRDPDRIREGARSCAAAIRDRHADRRPLLALQIECAGRGKILFGSRVDKELIAPLQDTLGGDVPWAGFHSYGEIAPIAGRTYYHNYTVGLSVLYDDDE